MKYEYPLRAEPLSPTEFKQGRWYKCVDTYNLHFTTEKVYLCCYLKSKETLYLVNNAGFLVRPTGSSFIPAGDA